MTSSGRDLRVEEGSTLAPTTAEVLLGAGLALAGVVLVAAVVVLLVQARRRRRDREAGPR